MGDTYHDCAEDGHVFDHCECGSVWRGPGPSPHGPEGAQAANGALGGPKSAARVQAVRGAAMTRRDKKTAKKFKAADARRSAGVAAASAQVAATAEIAQEFNAELQGALSALERLDDAERAHVTRTLVRLNTEAKKISKKDAVIRDLDERLKQAELGQGEIMCGIKSFKILAVVALLAIAASIVMGVVGKFGHGGT